MNSLNALGNRQIASLQADLSKMENGESGPSVQGTFAPLQHLPLRCVASRDRDDVQVSGRGELTLNRKYNNDIGRSVEVD